MTALQVEESIDFVRPLRVDQEYEINDKIVDIQDKGKGAAIIINSRISHKATGDLHANVRTTLFVRGLTGFGHKGTIHNKFPKIPTREHDFIAETWTDPNQAFLYRLSGDDNPLHVDPNMSSRGGFKKPILHGLCSFGFTTRVLQQHFFKDDVNLMENASVRLTSPVFPGETLVVKAWKEDNFIIYETSTKERGKVALRGYLRLRQGAKL